MSDLTKQAVLDRLRHVVGPDGRTDVVSAGMISEIVIEADKVMFALMVDPKQARALEPVRAAAQDAVQALPGVGKAFVTMTAEQMRQPDSGGGARPTTPPPRQQTGVPGVGAIIAVASGKGGVGKSTTAVNVALGLQALGLSVGVLDADIYGPSIPRLTGLRLHPDPNKPFPPTPPTAYGLKVMSMGFLVREDTPMIWRGPMVVSALTQLLREIHWAPLDVLVVDMPPGTGDVQLTMAQQVPLAGAVIVSTPQDLALIDARKGVAMFQKVDVPILGIIENMSYFLCPSCGSRSDIFGHGGAQQEAARIGVPFLGEVPLQMRIRENSDAGRPVVATAADSPEAAIFLQIAARAWESVQDAQSTAKPAPAIIMD